MSSTFTSRVVPVFASSERFETKPRRVARMHYFFFLLSILVVFGRAAHACPFCSALGNPLREELAQVDYAAIAVCTRTADEDAELPVYSFRIERMVKGAGSVGGKASVARLQGSLVEAYSPRDLHLGDRMLLFGIDGDRIIDWVASEVLSREAIDYLQNVVELSRSESPSEQSKLARIQTQNAWLNLYWNNLESEDAWIRKDAFNGLAKVSIEELRPWAKSVSAEAVRKRLALQSTSIEHARFYWTVLGLCGTSKDAEFVREAIFGQLNQRHSNSMTKDSIGLDAAISSYLLLGHHRALEEIERELLSNSERRVSERFSAISALRVHTQEFHVLDRKQICATLAKVLDDPDFADMVIPDLARLEDWTHIETLREKFRAESRPPFIRIPIIRYFRACPLGEAQKALAECKTIDPDAYRRARVIFPMAQEKSSRN